MRVNRRGRSAGLRRLRPGVSGRGWIAPDRRSALRFLGGFHDFKIAHWGDEPLRRDGGATLGFGPESLRYGARLCAKHQPKHVRLATGAELATRQVLPTR